MARFVRQFVSVNDVGGKEDQGPWIKGANAQKFNYFHLCELFVCQSEWTRRPKAFNVNVMKLQTQKDWNSK